MTRPRLTSTYRLQFSEEFTFAQARELIPYFRALGISHLYASPIFQARPGSSHGYDVVDHDAINPELGGEEGLRALSGSLRDAGLGLIADIVPNHAGIGGTGNARWQDVLEFGRKSRNARFFDIDWNAGPLVLPILDGSLVEVAEAGRFGLAIDRKAGRLVLTFEDHRLPLRPETVGRLLVRAGTRLDRPDLAEVGRGWAELEAVRPANPGRRVRREALADALADPAVQSDLARSLPPDEARAVAEEQHYRLMHWREGAQQINYRRFFDINDLAGLRVEEPAVFDAVHRLPLALVREGILDGLRIDHIDGLADPAGYCARLRSAVGPDVTLHVEKILGLGEALPDWGIDGTTGYETINAINGLFVDPAGYALLAEESTANGVQGEIHERIRAAKAEILERSFASEIDVLARLGADLSRSHGHPVRLRTMREIITSLIAALPVYRTYITETAQKRDADLIRQAAETARPELRRGGKRAMATLVDILLSGANDPETAAFIRRFQQLSGPAMAKGYEDTELYRNIPLASVNEVGSHLERPFLTIEAFHASMADTARRGLISLTPLSTHDTKRGADTRARINVLSELAGRWIELVNGWRTRHQDLRTALGDGLEAPDPTDEGFIYQTIVGVWPITADRVTAYLTKALREAKRHTTWTDQNGAYEEAVLSFARTLIEGESGRAFRADLEAFLEQLDPAGRRNSLGQTALQLTVPGIPDIYRGSEFYEFVLVDPDNRRPVDWAARMEGLRQSAGVNTPDPEGLAKQHLIAQILKVRQAHPDLFQRGDYQPLRVMGAEDVIAFGRHFDGESLVVAVPTRALAPQSGTIVIDVGQLPPSRWQACYGGEGLRAEGRLLRISRAALPAIVLSSAA